VHSVERIVSGGQTGVDRAALDTALALGIPCGGWVPQGRMAEDGRIPEGYPNLREADSPGPDVRTEWNVRDSDATLILSRGALTRGSAYTQEMALRHAKPWLHVNLADVSEEDAVGRVRAWLEDVRPKVLNVAGPRASGDPGIYDLVRAVLTKVLSSTDETDSHR
jgi:hypothetical protein